MIIYNNRGLLAFQLLGSSCLSRHVIVPAFLSSFLTAGLFYTAGPELVRWDLPVKTLLGVAGYVIVMRASKARQRFEYGVYAVQAMAARWNEAFTSFQCFLEVSIEDTAQRGDPDGIIPELMESRCKVTHWASLLMSLGVQMLQSKETGVSGQVDPDRFRHVEKLENRMHLGTIWWDQAQRTDMDDEPCQWQKLACKRHHRQAANEGPRKARQPDGIPGLLAEEWRPPELTLLGNLTPEEHQCLHCEDPTTMVGKWIIFEVNKLQGKGYLLMHPAIISRVIQEVSIGVTYFTNGMRVSHIPFPFPYAQFIDVFMLPCWFILFPCLIVRTLADKRASLQGYVREDLSTGDCIFGMMMTFLISAGFAAINQIARELEEPFGFDHNDFPVHLCMRRTVTALEDSHFTHKPLDSLESIGSPGDFGVHTSKAYRWVKRQKRKQAAAEKATPANIQEMTAAVRLTASEVRIFQQRLAAEERGRAERMKLCALAAQA